MPPLTSYVRSGPPPQLSQLMQGQGGQAAPTGRQTLAGILQMLGSGAADIYQAHAEEKRAAPMRALQAWGQVAPIISAQETATLRRAQAEETRETTARLRRSDAEFSEMMQNISQVGQEGGPTGDQLWRELWKSTDLMPEHVETLGKVLTDLSGEQTKKRNLARQELKMVLGANFGNPLPGRPGHDPELWAAQVKKAKELGLGDMDLTKRNVAYAMWASFPDALEYESVDPFARMELKPPGLFFADDTIPPVPTEGVPADIPTAQTLTPGRQLTPQGLQPTTPEVQPTTPEVQLTPQGIQPAPTTGDVSGVPTPSPAVTPMAQTQGLASTAAERFGVPQTIHGGEDLTKSQMVYRVNPDNPQEVYEWDIYRRDPKYGNRMGHMPSDEAVGTELTSTQLDRLTEVRQAVGALKDLGNILQGSKRTGALRGIVATFPEMFDPAIQAGIDLFGDEETEDYVLTTRQIESVVRSTRQYVGKMLEGGVLRREDELKYKAILTDIMNQPEVAQFKADEFLRVTENRLYDQFADFRKAGFNTHRYMAEEGFGGVPPHVALIEPGKETLTWFSVKTPEDVSDVYDFVNAGYTFDYAPHQAAFEKRWDVDAGIYTPTMYPRQMFR
jgi:hypothetical protein